MAVAQPALDYLARGYASPRSIGAYEASPATVRRAPARLPGATWSGTRALVRVTSGADGRGWGDGVFLLDGRTAPSATAAGVWLDPASFAR
jgi:hypothetical protein